MKLREGLLGAGGWVMLASMASAQTPAPATNESASAALSSASVPLDNAAAPVSKAATPEVSAVVVTAQRLNAARASIQPSLGATTYTVTNAAIQALPGGDNQQLNQMLLQLPGVSQDSFGQFHVRDHNNLQYRLNGIIIPEGISVFGQTLSPRLVENWIW